MQLQALAMPLTYHHCKKLQIHHFELTLFKVITFQTLEETLSLKTTVTIGHQRHPSQRQRQQRRPQRLLRQQRQQERIQVVEQSKSQIDDTDIVNMAAAANAFMKNEDFATQGEKATPKMVINALLGALCLI